MNFTPIPTPQQAAFQDWAFGLFFHFGIRTFYEGHRGLGTASPCPPAPLTPPALDCRQWTAAARAAGANMRCWWPSITTALPTAHPVQRLFRGPNPLEGGKRDVVREFVEACRADNLKVGLYYSPAQAGFLNWQPREYDDYFVNQITELLTNYGKIDYLWFDACGSGDHRYDTPRIVQVIRRLQPDILLFNLWDPDTRWIGNESGWPDWRPGAMWTPWTPQLTCPIPRKWPGGPSCLPSVTAASEATPGSTATPTRIN